MYKGVRKKSVIKIFTFSFLFSLVIYFLLGKIMVSGNHPYLPEGTFLLVLILQIILCSTGIKVYRKRFLKFPFDLFISPDWNETSIFTRLAVSSSFFTASAMIALWMYLIYGNGSWFNWSLIVSAFLIVSARNSLVNKKYSPMDSVPEAIVESTEEAFEEEEQEDENWIKGEEEEDEKEEEKIILEDPTQEEPIEEQTVINGPGSEFDSESMIDLNAHDRNSV
jgi:hypothetical protein